jgi:hypothetical protein
MGRFSHGTFQMQASAIARGAISRLGIRSYPISLTFELTWLCNLACSYCDRHTPMRHEMSREEVFSALDQAYALGMETRPPCAAGWITATLAPEGVLFPCGQVNRSDRSNNVLRLGMREAFDRLPNPDSDLWHDVCTLPC